MSAANGRNLDALVRLPPVLDVCCGTRGMWFDKRNPLAMFTDRVEMSGKVSWAEVIRDIANDHD